MGDQEIKKSTLKLHRKKGNKKQQNTVECISLGLTERINRQWRKTYDKSYS